MSKKIDVRFYDRQGDVCVVAFDGEIPASAEEVPRDAHGRFVLARGETTDHVHVVRSEAAALLRLPDGRVLLKARDLVRMLDEPTRPGHPAPGRTPHDDLELPPGVYEVLRQWEYTPEVERPVGD